MALRCVVCLVVARTGPRSDGVVAPQRMRQGSGPKEPSWVVNCVAASSVKEGAGISPVLPETSPSIKVDGSDLTRVSDSAESARGLLGLVGLAPASSQAYVAPNANCFSKASLATMSLALSTPVAPKSRSPASPRPGNSPPSLASRPSTWIAYTSTSGCASCNARKPSADARITQATIRCAPHAFSLAMTGVMVLAVATTGSRMNAMSQESPPCFGSLE
mmetsp:Transcript_23963/g.62491  ORF Transcript_23963/g.62491 Transcript_23963/m.62491 type:complete len:219 (+) Transcript_23963:519-1175(+)